jgi:hypothetical protein
MKNIIVLFAAALFIGVGAANAQSSTTDKKNPGKSKQQNSQGSSDQMKKDRSTDRGDAGKNADMTLIHTADVPMPLRESLHGSDYKGWENGRVYKTKNGEYIVEIDNKGRTTTHRFDANGKPITK